jgi:tRNA(Arg) A34 adenosine deaminase TadA
MLNRRTSVKTAIICIMALLLLQPAIFASDSISHPIKNRAEFYAYAKTLPLNIHDNDDFKTILKKIEIYLNYYKAKNLEEQYAVEATKQALYGCQTGGYGIGAILVDPKGNIVERAYNEMRQQARSDLHGEMNLLNKFETKRTSPVSGAGFQLPTGYVVVSSAEPCPMCMIRLAHAGVDTLYVAQNDDDSLSRHLDRLPGFWRKVCEKHPCVKAQVSEDLENVAFLLFYCSVFLEKFSGNPAK